MEYRRLGRTGLKVSEFCLGTMQWGWTATEAQSQEVMDAFVDAGGNFLDTADVYSRWAEGNPGGVSEQIIGRWMKARGNRHQIVLATRRAAHVGWAERRGVEPGASDQGVRGLAAAAGTDYIDLYQTHWADENTPIDETLRALDDLVRAGKVRYIGCSNYPAWRLMEALWASEKLGLARYDSLQPHYNLAHRAEFERELKPVCEQYGIGVIPIARWPAGSSPASIGRDNVPDSARADGVKQRYLNERGFAILDALDSVAQAHNLTPGATALAWLFTQPVITAPIVGANSVAQLQDSLKASGVRLTDEEMAQLNEASAWQ